ncbi:MAG: FAD-dependent oxidoreductase [Planctomycetes bacterium]|nr:FAD-dependent oxidoreductase [Planctomycetota bacterium]
MSTRAAVIGGGISGLASALLLARQGERVVLYETDAAPGGLGSTFVYDGRSYEKFYHCLLPGDGALLQLLNSIGLEKSIDWRDVGMGFMENRRIYPMNGPADILRFAPLSMIERLRLGLFGLRARRGGAESELDAISVRDWICTLAGAGVYNKLFKTLLEAKLGEGAGGIPALWLSSRIQREKSNNTERKGYIPGGYRAIVAAVVAELERLGVKIRAQSPVESLSLEGGGVAVTPRGEAGELYDRAVVAAPFIEFQRLVAGIPEARAAASLKLDYQGVVNSVFFLKKQLTPHYWLPIVNSGAGAQGLVELTNLVPTSATGGLHVAYLLNYTHRNGAFYNKSESELAESYRKDLVSLFAEAEGAIVDQFVFKAPFVEPIWPLGYSKLRPPVEAVAGKIYLVTTAQVYPRVNAWNSCCEVAGEMAGAYARAPRPAVVASRRQGGGEA